MVKYYDKRRAMKTWIVLCKDGGRISSVENTEQNMEEIKKQFYYNVMFKNYDGTVYLNVTGLKRSK